MGYLDEQTFRELHPGWYDGSISIKKDETVNNNDLTFDTFQRTNAKRCREAFDQNLHDEEFFCIAIAGEVGEMCNEYKKVLRGDVPLDAVRGKLLAELADIITYADLMITKLGGNTEIELIRKFNIVSDRRNCDIKLK